MKVCHIYEGNITGSALGISTYFNPGEMIAIMGPSGCGKTTFMDLVTGRRKKDTFSVRYKI